jgi:hypothetical protein
VHGRSKLTKGHVGSQERGLLSGEAHYGRTWNEVEEGVEVATDDVGPKQHRRWDRHQEVEGWEVGRVVDGLDEERVTWPLTHLLRQYSVYPPMAE